MAAYVIVEITIHDPSVYDNYKALAPASIAQYGGHRGRRFARLDGHADSRRR